MFPGKASPQYNQDAHERLAMAYRFAPRIPKATGLGRWKERFHEFPPSLRRGGSFQSVQTRLVGRQEGGGKRMNAVLYARVARAEEAELRLLRYRTFCRRYAEREELVIVGEFEDVGSGMRLERPGLSALRELVARETVDAVVLYDLSQLTRSALHWAVLQRELALRGAKLHAALRDMVI